VQTSSVCRQCRREGLKLFLKGDRCYTEKCSVDRRNYPPGQHGQKRRRKVTEYGLQLREKQKVKRIYGLGERQFHSTFEKADRKKGITGEILLAFLERRLDNVVYRLGFSGSRRQARQLVRHRHFSVNGCTVNIPSFMIKEGDEIKVRDRSKEKDVIDVALAAVDRRGVPEWLELDESGKNGKVRALPVRSDVSEQIQEQLIVELYSK